MSETGLNEELDAATKKVTALAREVKKLGAELKDLTPAASSGGGGIFSKLFGGNLLGVGANRPGTGADGAKFGAAPSAGGNMGGVVSALGKFGAVGQAVSGAGQMASGLATGMPGVQDVLQYSKGYYGASIYAGGANRKLMQQATFGAMSQGMTSTGADARVASLLTSRGMAFSSMSGSTYMQTAQTAGNISKYLNMDVERSTAAVADMTNAGGASTLLKRFGIFSSDLATGKEKTMPQIFEELAGRLQVRGSTAERTSQSIRKGALGVSIQNSGLSQDQQALFSQYMIDRAGGKSTDWLNDKSLGNDNPLSSTYALNASATKQYGKAEDSYIQGIKDAVPTISALNDAFGNLAKTVGSLNATMQTLGGAPSAQGVMGSVAGGAGIGAAIGTLIAPGVGTAIGAVAGGLFGAAVPFVGSGGESGKSSSKSTSSAKKSNQLGKGAQSFTSPISGGQVTARLGQKGPYWDKDVGHRGTDFKAAQGTPVKSIGEGQVIDLPTGGELGNQIKIKHSNGFVSHYCHLSSVSVSASSSVTQGQRIGSSGNTGSNSHGPHLHFVLYNSGGTSVDPFNYLAGLSDASGNTSTGAGVQSTTGTDGATAPSSNGDKNGSYVGTSSVVTSGISGISFSDNSTNSILGISAPTSGKMPESINGSSFNSGKSTTGYKTNAPGAKTGVDYVPQDGTYNLHQGESVRTAEETSAYRQGKEGGKARGSNVTINVTVARASEEEARRMVKLMKEMINDDAHILQAGKR
jgi:hypothetical protein